VSVVFSVSAPADVTGIAVLCSAARTALSVRTAEGEGAGLVVRYLAEDAARRLGGGVENAVLSLEAEFRGTEYVVTIHDLGEPVTGPPEGVLALLEAGVLTSAEARVDGTSNVSEVRFALPEHNRIVDTEGVTIVDEDAETTDEPVTVRRLVREDAAALTRAIYRCYGWSYPNPNLYYPERIAASLDAGERLGWVAVTDDGEVAAHWGAVFASPTVVETGNTVTDPRFRGRGLAKTLGERLLDELLELGVAGRLREPVLTHPATQKIAVQEGATVVGAYINMAHPIQQVGITDGLQPTRSSLSVAYGALTPLSPATMHVPAPYERFVARALDAAQWPRAVLGASRDAGVAHRTVLSTSYNADNRSGTVEVAVAGHDLTDEVQAVIGQMQRSGAEYVQVRLPLNQPGLATFGAGLPELGLSYAAVVPAFRPTPDSPGDVLITQWIADLDVDPESWVFANDQIRDLVLDIVEQARDVGSRGRTRQRRAAQRAQLFAALET